MTFLNSRAVRGVLLLAALSVVASCGLPRPGPNKREVFAGSVQREGDAFVVTVNDRVTRATAVVPALGFSDNFLRAGILASDVIRPGDKLSLTIWENVDDGLLAPEGANRTQIEEVQVDGEGFIFVPYAGPIRAAGKTPEMVRQIITRKLADQTPDPQVEVRRVPGDGSTVTVSGAVGTPGIFAIERPTRTLSAVLARAGGPTIKPEVTRVRVVRGNRSGEIWYQDLVEQPEYDIALRGGDKVFVEEDRRAFTVLGATGKQARMPFDTRTLSAAEALAQVGGLSATASDPTGVFVLRNEPAEIANQVLGRDDLQGPQRMIYVLDLTRPNGLFLARDFVIRDGDTVYVTEAPFTQFSRVVSAITGTLGAAGTVTGTAQSLAAAAP